MKKLRCGIALLLALILTLSLGVTAFACDETECIVRPPRTVPTGIKTNSDAAFSIPSGKVVAVVGATGSGKSTMTDVLRRYFELNEGKIQQPVITKDNVTMQIDTVVYFQITDPKLYTYGVEPLWNAAVYPVAPSSPMADGVDEGAAAGRRNHFYPEATDAVQQDGWFHTGNLGFRDGQGTGYPEITGRVNGREDRNVRIIETGFGVDGDSCTIQAGRERRIHVKSEFTYPGQVKVNVIRENRNADLAQNVWGCRIAAGGHIGFEAYPDADYMRTVMREEPLDPSLLDFNDSMTW